MHRSYDVVVIGSGFGGAVLACRLAQAGDTQRRICILERGRTHPASSFPDSLSGIARYGLWDKSTNRHGYLEYRGFDHLEVIQGSGVGGGSLHYFGVSLRAPADVFDRRLGNERVWPAAISRDVLDPYYYLAETMLGVEPIKPTAEFPDLPRKTVAFQQAVYATGRRATLVPLAVNFDAAGRPPCDHRGHCLIGCGRDAKNSLDRNYLKVAKDHGVEVLELSEAGNIEPLAADRFRVHFERLDPGRHEEVEAKMVVIAAGCLGSTDLLLRCRDVHGTLPNLSHALGQRFSANGDYLYAGGVMPRSLPVEPTRGPSVTAGADFSTAANRIYVEDLGITEHFKAFLRATATDNRLFLDGVRLLLPQAFDRERIDLQTPEIQFGRVGRFLPYLAMGTDTGTGTMSLRNGKLFIDWPYDANEPLYSEIRAALKDMSERSEGVFHDNLWVQEGKKKTFTAHPLGGCVMGDSAVSSVVDELGQIWGHPNLYVVDGGIIPGALAVNPSLTIAAVAERIAFWMVHGREMAANDPEAPPNS